MKVAILVAAITATAWAQTEADASRGPQILKAQNCDRCHAIGPNEKGTAPTLGRSLNREYSPAGLVSAMWNHAPTMWRAMEQAKIAHPKLSTKDSADVMAYFASLRFFEPAGDSARGLKLLQNKGCVQCHAIAGTGSGVAKPIPEWDDIGDPVVIVQRMWNHAPQMKKALSEKLMKWPNLTPQDLSDIMVYARTSPGRAASRPQFTMPTVETGASLLESNGCVTCHKGSLSLDARTTNRTLTEIAAAMWNHAPKMLQNPMEITSDEMNKIVGYLWGRQFLHPTGSVDSGRKLFMSSKCDTCHGLPGAPKLEGRVSTVRMISAIWEHGPQMQEKLQAQKDAWPKLNERQMSDMISYLDWRAGGGKEPAK